LRPQNLSSIHGPGDAFLAAESAMESIALRKTSSITLRYIGRSNNAEQ